MTIKYLKEESVYGVSVKMSEPESPKTPLFPVNYRASERT